MQVYLSWEKRPIKWWKKKFGVSEHGIAWTSFIKGILVGLLVYRLFLIVYDLRQK